ncbi:hypothetical protein LTR62_007959 [Meristemomyces frigidus]|uniref:PAN2-PAN3 deadenylation complex subunit PAN3 n=1 Tax=Meristemomyces frigidus TaxID=1508187 RepID=A0AAN7YT24_9PEZI|nr:hypothetical protein LTR62_007959 [Meristemomyces frigidus]
MAASQPSTPKKPFAPAALHSLLHESEPLTRPSTLLEPIGTPHRARSYQRTSVQKAGLTNHPDNRLTPREPRDSLTLAPPPGISVAKGRYLWGLIVRLPPCKSVTRTETVDHQSIGHVVEYPELKTKQDWRKLYQDAEASYKLYFAIAAELDREIAPIKASIEEYRLQHFEFYSWRFVQSKEPSQDFIFDHGPPIVQIPQVPFASDIFQKKSLNVESPAFTPNFTPPTTKVLPVKSLGLSPRAAGAATFTPRGSGSVTPAGTSHSKHISEEFIPQNSFQPQPHFHEFVPGQNFVQQPQVDSPPQMHQVNPYSDPFMSPQTLQQALPSLDGTQPQINPYSQTSPAVTSQPYYQDANSYKYPLNYHLYASVGPRRENMQPYQRASADFFIPDNVREDLHKRSEAALQVFANSTLPQSVEHFHSLVALDTNSQRSTTTFGYPSWIYKATSSKDGHTYALRRIEGFRLTNEQAIRSFQGWKRVSSAGVVRVHDAFTGRWFGDSSLIVVTDYHPLAQTVAEKYHNAARVGKGGAQYVPENDLWAYIVQLASALKAVHEAGLAAQTVTASKVLITSKNRLRLGGCGVLDITQFEQRPQTPELQRQDLQNLGGLILCIAARNPMAHQSAQKSIEAISRAYSERFRACLTWLLTPPAADDPLSPTSSSSDENAAITTTEYHISTLLTNISDKVVAALDSTLHSSDETTNQLTRELENGRLVRLLTKLNIILERPEPPSSTNPTPPTNLPSTSWSETGDRYHLKLFRDYVFHQIDHEGRPVLNLGHIITCLNKLDAGVDELVQLVSRDERDCLVVSYREVKRGFEGAWGEITRGGGGGRR